MSECGSEGARGDGERRIDSGVKYRLGLKDTLAFKCSSKTRWVNVIAQKTKTNSAAAYI